ncbi:hypothetical protein ACP4OV_010397 [Aristida adscensionis]
MASTDVILSSPVASEGFIKTKYLASPAVQMSEEIGVSSSKRQQVKMEVRSSAAVKKLKPRFAVELDGLNCFETLVPR